MGHGMGGSNIRAHAHTQSYVLIVIPAFGLCRFNEFAWISLTNLTRIFSIFFDSKKLLINRFDRIQRAAMLNADAISLSFLLRLQSTIFEKVSIEFNRSLMQY